MEKKGKKSKKNQKRRQDSDSEEDTHLPPIKNDDGDKVENTGTEAVSKKDKRKIKRKDKKEAKALQHDDDDDDNIVARNKNDDDDEEEDEIVVVKSKPKMKPRFAMLLEDEGDDDDDEEDDEEVVVVEKKNKENSGKNQKAKNKKQKTKVGDDDFDAILSQFTDVTIPPKKSEKKKKKGRKDEEEKEEEVTDNNNNTQQQPPSSTTTTTTVSSTQDDISKRLQEMELEYEEEEEENRKKKKKTKKGGNDKTNNGSIEGTKKDTQTNTQTETQTETQTNTQTNTQTGDTEQKTNDKKKENVVDDDIKNERLKKEKDGDEEGDEEGDNDGGDNDGGDNDGGDNDGGGVKTAAQKRKEKRERQRLEKLKEKKTEGSRVVDVTKVDNEAEANIPADVNVTDKADEEKKEEDEEEEEGADKKKGKKDRKKKGEKKEEKNKKNKMGSMIKEAQLMLKQRQEEAERVEVERVRKEEERIREIEEKEQLEREKKERKKQKEKERKLRLKAEGKYLTDKQKEDRRRALELLESVGGVGVIPPVQPESDQVKKVVYARKKKAPKTTAADSTDSTTTLATTTLTTTTLATTTLTTTTSATTTPATTTPATTTPTTPTTPENDGKLLLTDVSEVATKDDDDDEDEDVDGVKDNWDESSEEEEEEEDDVDVVDGVVTNGDSKKASNIASVNKKKDEEEEDDDSDDDDSDSDEDKTMEELSREKAVARIKRRKDEAEGEKSLDNLRAPIICVLGHVDTGKTKILDKLRRTHVQDGEAGGITQQIGATNVPLQAVKDQTKMIKDFELKLPGLLFIDTPGHESFSNLRTRGSSLCDIAILVVDLMHGLEPQTIESIQILKSKKTPFIVALNKIDRLFNWVTNPHSDIVNLIRKQKNNTKLEFDERVSQTIVQFAEQGLNARLFYENKNPKEFISLVPTSAMTGDGMGNLIALLCDLTQTMLMKRLQFSRQLQATVMEVKMTPGHGATLDVILVNGSLKTGSSIVVAGQDGPIVTQIRSLLLPQPMQELRVKGQFQQEKEVTAARGCKVAAKDLEKALPGLPLMVAHYPDEVEIYKEELSELLKDVLGDVKLTEKGVFVQASTLGSLEALLSFLKSSDIPYAGINIGPVHKKDITKASVMLEQDPRYAVILAFDVKIEREAQEMADREGIRIFSADIIYHLFDQFTAYRDDYKKQKQLEFKHIAMFPCKLRILPECVFKTRDPIILGVHVEGGFIKEGTVLCVPSKEFVHLGRVSSIEFNHKVVEKATKGQEVCIKIDNIPGEAPKLYGRHFDQSDILVSKISRESIDAIKNWFRDDMDKTDWQLILELKKIFQIL